MTICHCCLVYCAFTFTNFFLFLLPARRVTPPTTMLRLSLFLSLSLSLSLFTSGAKWQIIALNDYVDDQFTTRDWKRRRKGKEGRAPFSGGTPQHGSLRRGTCRPNQFAAHTHTHTNAHTTIHSPFYYCLLSLLLLLYSALKLTSTEQPNQQQQHDHHHNDTRSGH